MRALWLAAPLLLASALLALALAPPGEAHATTTVPPSWYLVPPGMGEGDSFRLLFVTSEKTTMERMRSLAKLDEFVRNAAERGFFAIRSYANEFHAVASCGTTDAQHHTSTTYTSDDPGVPIYWLNGAKVADDYADFYDGSWDSHDPKNESGGGFSVYIATVWTGTNSDGTSSRDHACRSWITAGTPTRIWSELDFFATSMEYPGHVYGLSPVFLVSHAPSSPGQPVVSEVTHNSASLRWSAPIQSGATAIFDYNVQIKRAADSSWVGSTPYHWGTDTTHTLTGLSPDTEYQVRVFAKNHGTGGSDVGYGPTSPVTTFRTQTVEPSAPGRPMVDQSDMTAIVSWTAPAWPGSPPLNDYDMTVRPAPGVPVGVHGTGTSHTLAGLEPDTRYEVQVRANNSAGHSPWSPVATFRTLPPSSTVPADWQLVPSGLGEGDRFHLLFVASNTKTDVGSMWVHNTFVRAAAAASNYHDAIIPHAGGFRALMSN